jgi:hypothetical protein
MNNPEINGGPGASRFTGELIKMTAPGVHALTAQLTDAEGNQYIIAAPLGEDLKRILKKHFPDIQVSEKQFVRVSILIHEN